jgi:ureidoacrylate peracid hydrolase
MTDSFSLPSRYWRIVDTAAGPRGYVEEDVEHEVGRTALLIVDAYGAGYGDGPVPPELTGIYEPEPTVAHIIRNLIPPVKAAARARGLDTIYLTNALRPGLDEGNAWRNLSLRATGVDVLTEWVAPTPILEFSDVVAPDSQDVVIEKQLYSGFFETTLDSTLRNRGITDLIIVGFDSRICLGTTATDAMFRNYRVTVLRDCTTTFEFPETAEGGWANFMAIRYFETQVGHTSTSDEFLAAVAP